MDYAPHENWRCSSAYCDDPPGWREEENSVEKISVYDTESTFVASEYGDGYWDLETYSADEYTPERFVEFYVALGNMIHEKRLGIFSHSAYRKGGGLMPPCGDQCNHCGRCEKCGNCAERSCDNCKHCGGAK